MNTIRIVEGEVVSCSRRCAPRRGARAHFAHTPPRSSDPCASLRGNFICFFLNKTIGQLEAPHVSVRSLTSASSKLISRQISILKDNKKIYILYIYRFPSFCFHRRAPAWLSFQNCFRVKTFGIAFSRTPPTSSPPALPPPSRRGPLSPARQKKCAARTRTPAAVCA